MSKKLKKRLIRLVVGIGLVAFGFEGCTSLPSLPPPLPPETPHVPAHQETQTALPIGAEDVINIVVYGHDNLSGHMVIASDGSFSYPLLGRVEAAGMTAQELASHLTKALSEYLVNPQVSVTMEQFHSQQVYVVGEVRSPGPYVLKHASTLLEILVGAGGPTPNAGWEVMVVRADARDNGVVPAGREAPADRATVRVDLEKLLAGELGQPVQVHDGDTIYLPRAAFFYVNGEIQRPGQYRLERDMTVAKALALCGGVTRFAAKSRMKVRRLVAGQRQEFRARMHDLLQPDDVLIVPETTF